MEADASTATSKSETLQYIYKYVATMREMNRMLPQNPDRFRYFGMEDLVHHWGFAFQYAPLPRSIRKAPFRKCYQNAAHLAIREPGLVYVEGIAYSGLIATGHAWCVTSNGTVIDPTWKRNSVGDRAYVGVPFDQRFLRDVLIEKETYGMLDYMPLFFKDGPAPEEFVHADWIERVRTSTEVRESTKLKTPFNPDTFQL